VHILFLYATAVVVLLILRQDCCADKSFVTARRRARGWCNEKCAPHGADFDSCSTRSSGFDCMVQRKSPQKVLPRLGHHNKPVDFLGSLQLLASGHDGQSGPCGPTMGVFDSVTTMRAVSRSRRTVSRDVHTVGPERVPNRHLFVLPGWPVSRRKSHQCVVRGLGFPAAWVLRWEKKMGQGRLEQDGHVD
jgi:hypothetical protein